MEYTIKVQVWQNWNLSRLLQHLHVLSYIPPQLVIVVCCTVQCWSLYAEFIKKHEKKLFSVTTYFKVQTVKELIKSNLKNRLALQQSCNTGCLKT